MEASGLLYRLVGPGGAIEVFDDRIVLVQVGRRPALSEEVNKLAQLHARGVLSDDEFAAAKQQLIGSHHPAP